MAVLHTYKSGNGYMVAQAISKHFNCETIAIEDDPSVSQYKTLVIVASNRGDEELPKLMEDYLFGLRDAAKNYFVCELGNYFGFENYSGCKKVVIQILDSLGWKKLDDLSLDSYPEVDSAALEAWLRKISNLDKSG
jgi:flavodoxin